MSGSVLDIISDTSAQYALQKSQAIYQGELESAGYTAQAAQEEASGKAAKRTGYLSAAGTLLSGGAGAYGAYKRLG